MMELLIVMFLGALMAAVSALRLISPDGEDITQAQISVLGFILGATVFGYTAMIGVFECLLWLINHT
jgi:hypothetical protein